MIDKFPNHESRPRTPRPGPILPTIDLGLDEIYVTAAPLTLGEFMPVLSVSLLRRGLKHQRPAVFSLS